MKSHLIAALSTLVVGLSLVAPRAEAKLQNYPGRLKVTAYQYVGSQVTETHSWKGRIREAHIVTQAEGVTYLRLVASSGECSMEMYQHNALSLLSFMEAGIELDFVCFAEAATQPASNIDNLYTTEYSVVSKP